MRISVRLGVLAATAALMGSTALAGAANAAGKPAPPNKPVATVQFAGGQGHGLTMERNAPEGTQKTLEANIPAASAASNVCGTGYTISTGAWRYGTYGTTYTWTNGTTTGSSYYDKPICAVFFNDTGLTKYMGVRLKSNYTADAPASDFGAYGSYAGPVHQRRGYCGTVYSYMESSSGTVLVDNLQRVGACN